MSKAHVAYLLTGSNQGDRFEYLERARAYIHQLAGTVVSVSHFYESKAWGIEDQADFLNQAIKIETLLSPEDLLTTLLDIEKQLGRERAVKWGCRTIDIDILLYDDIILQTEKLTIPHKYIHERNFTLIPLMEIAGEVVHPLLEKSIEELYWASEDSLEVYRLETL